jgi:hypothetical protein
LKGRSGRPEWKEVVEDMRGKEGRSGRRDGRSGRKEKGDVKEGRMDRGMGGSKGEQGRTDASTPPPRPLPSPHLPADFILDYNIPEDCTFCTGLSLLT